MKVRYVEEDDQKREQCAGEADKDYEPELWEVRQCGDPQLGGARGEQAGQAGHRRHLVNSRVNQCYQKSESVGYY